MHHTDTEHERTHAALSNPKVVGALRAHKYNGKRKPSQKKERRETLDGLKYLERWGFLEPSSQNPIYQAVRRY